MGAWGAGPFDNDTALDLLSEYEDDGASVLSDWMAEAKSGEAGYIDADLGSAAIATGEIVAACHDVPMPGALAGSEDLGELMAQMTRHKDDVLQEDGLLDAVGTLVGPSLLDPDRSELAALWAEADPLDATAFRKNTEDLIARLGRVPR